MTRYHGDREEVQALGAFVKLMRAADSVASAVHHKLSEVDLTISQFGVLEALYHLGSLCQKEIAAKILKSTGNITMVIDNLEKRKLVSRTRDETDRRYYNINLTAKGRELVKSIFPEHAARIKERMSRLSRDELRELGRLCRKLGKEGAQHA